jgi:2-polyprenyl-3-methyl-5-hydroxy-6-metoxy-1,4-benzoquinol methylase
MDLAWHETGCESSNPHPESMIRFYKHPVWLLNGLFIEQHQDSISHREKFVEEILKHKPAKVCDYGGGYGSLARMIAKVSATTTVESFDPHPHSSALDLSSQLDNVRHVDELDGPYDVMVATDVFEHVHDPLLDVEKTSRHLKVDGCYLIANCFYPVIKCHLPCTFHFRNSFSSILAEMNLLPVKNVVYGTVFKKTGNVLVTPRIRRLEHKSRLRFAWQGVLDAVRDLRQQWLNKGFS